MLGQDPVVDIKSRLSIEDVVAPYVQLKRTGRSLKGLCPFHAEKTPSFNVSPERQLAYCFGCHKGGDMFAFIEEIENVDFKGALEILADKAGVDLQQYKTSVGKAPRVSKDRKSELFRVNEEAAKFFEGRLWGTEEGKKVLDYLEERGLTPQTIRGFGVGLSPDSFEEATAHLVQKKCSIEDLREVGLVGSKDTAGEKFFDKFRLRLMFPIHDPQGKIVGFGGRALRKDDQPKYLNSPESVLYHKSEVLYGYYQAKASIKSADFAVVVEGYVDVMASHQAGITQAVASSGTALAEAQLKLISRLTTNVVFSFDTDSAGEEALRRAVLLAQPLGLHLKIVRIPEGIKDPADCVKQDPELWKKAVNEAPFYLDYYLQEAGKRFDLTSAQGKDQASAYFLPFLVHSTPLERDHYLKALAALLKTESEFVYETFKNLTRKEKKTFRQAQGDTGRLGTGGQDSPLRSESAPGLSEYFLGLLLRFPGQITPQVLALPETLFEDSLKNVYRTLCSQYNHSARAPATAVLECVPDDIKKRLEVCMLWAEARNTDLAEEVIAREMKEMAERLQKEHQERRSKRLLHEIAEARTQGNIDRERQLFQDYSALYGTD